MQRKAVPHLKETLMLSNMETLYSCVDGRGSGPHWDLHRSGRVKRRLRLLVGLLQSDNEATLDDCQKHNTR